MLPHAGRVTFFLCRWPDGAAVPVSLAPGATAEEQHAVGRALAAWQRTTGLELVPLEGGGGAIEITLEDGAVITGAGGDTGNAVVDCRIAPLSAQKGGDRVAGAVLEHARLRIARQAHEDWRGRSRALTPAELAGTVLHELGHALGFQGHARRGDTVMTREVERIPRWGRALLAGDPFGDPTLRALYALPSGAVVASTSVEPWRTDLVDRMARLAEANGLEGPFARVGEAAARVFWRDARGLEYGLAVVELRAALRDPRKLLVVPEARTRRSLARSRDLRPDE